MADGVIKSIILAGGEGSGLWPLSRKCYPKQFLQLNGRSLFQDTYIRTHNISSPEDIIIVTGKAFRYHVKNQINELGCSINDNQILCESVGRNTLPAIAWGTKVLYDKFGDSTIAVFPSDHLIDEQVIKKINDASNLAEKYIVIFGIKPSTPHTGYGYIQPGKSIRNGYKVSDFKEKPDQKTAENYLNNGYLWNSGMFLFSASCFFNEMKKHQKKLYDQFQADDLDYNSIESLSMDYGLIEKSEHVAVVPLDLQWNDLGSFRSLYEVSEKDPNGNAGSAEYINSTGNYVYTHDKKAALIGISNTAVIDTKDAILVCRLDDAESIRELVQILEQKNDDVIRFHRTVYRPWGSYTILETKSFFKIKRVTVNQKQSLSLQKHHHRSEHWIVVSGTAEVQLGENIQMLSNGESTFVEKGMLHRLRNPGNITLEIIEVQIGEYLEEDDIVRFDDDYGRIKYK